MQPVTLSPRRILLAALLLVVALLVGVRTLARTDAPAPASAPAPVVVRADAPAASAKLVVHVVGAVRRPGLYRLREGTRVADAVARAGGVTRNAALALVNLAAPVADGQQVVVPVRVPAVAGGVPPAGGVTGAPGPVQLSTATAEQLDELPGVGPVTAQKIVDWRTAHGPFRSVEELPTQSTGGASISSRGPVTTRAARVVSAALRRHCEREGPGGDLFLAPGRLDVVIGDFCR